MKPGKFILTLFFIILFWNSSVRAQVYINEFHATNASSNLDEEFNEFSDWIELYNGSSQGISLNGYALSDDPLEPQKWIISGLYLPAWSYAVIWADKVGTGLHTNFKLDGDGETLLLTSPGGSIVDSVTFGEQYPDVSQGRYPDGGNWYYYALPSPGTSNSSTNYALNSQPAEAVTFSPAPGFYAGGVEVNLSHSDPDAAIYYTLDGSAPDPSDILYTTPVQISATQVIRARAFPDNDLPGTDRSATYFVNENFDLPVVSLSFDEDYFWDPEIGIYLEENRDFEIQCERPVNMEIFDPRNPYISMGAGTRLFGGYSQLNPMASLAVFARQEYGSKSLQSKLFNDKDITKFKSFVLRNSGNDWPHTLFRDAFMQNLVKDRMDVDYQEYMPSIVFFNGEYWGIHNIREKINEDYLEGNYGVDADSVDIISVEYEVLAGSDQDYRELMDFVQYNNPADAANYEIIKDWMDIDEFMNYRIVEIYVINQDWPNNNRKFWREQKEGSKWRWMLFDLDFGFGWYMTSPNMVWWATDPSEPQNYLFNRLLLNEDFRNEFLQRFRAHMNTSFQPDRVIGKIDSIQDLLRPYMDRHIDRWSRPSSTAKWDEYVDDLRTFSQERLPWLKTNLDNKFNPGPDITLTVLNADPGKGKVLACEVELPDEFSGNFYRDLPIRLEAVPAEGYTFTGWSGYLSDTSASIVLNISSSVQLEAHFTPQEPVEDIFINEMLAKNTRSITDEHQEREDWIELMNAGDSYQDLAGLLLSDDRNDLNKFRIPYGISEQTALEAGAKIILFADNDINQGPLHLNFKLSADGETIYLSQVYNGDTLILDSLSFGEQFANVSYGRLPDGYQNTSYMMATPGEVNQHYPVVSGIYINEFSAHNTTGLTDPEGNYTDWIELYNSNVMAMDVGGMFLTDSLPYPFKYRISDENSDSTTIPAGAYMIFYADNKAMPGLLHTNFKLSREGEQLGLAVPDGSSYADSLSYSDHYRNASLSRYPNAAESWVSIPPTPGQENIYTPVQGVIINEFSADNSTILMDEKGQYADWLELYNTNAFPVDLGGLFLTDSLNLTSKCRIPTTSSDSTTMGPGEYMIFFADNDPDKGIRHLDFKLSRSGEQLGLFGPIGEELEGISFDKQYRNASSSRYPNATGTWTCIPSTPGAENSYTAVEGIIINEFSADNIDLLESGNDEFADWIELYNSNPYAVDLGGLYLTDSLDAPTKSRIPTTAGDSTTIAANGYLVLFADNETDKGVRHVDFKLSRGGEQLGLSGHLGEILDSFSYAKQYRNASLSRFPDASSSWACIPSTPGESNLFIPLENVYINEISASNSRYADEFGEFDDWIELYNANNFAVNLAGYFMTDSLAIADKFRIPSTDRQATRIPAHDYLILWADDSTEQGELHLSFKLSASGEEVGLSQPDMSSLDSYVYAEQESNAAISRYPDGAAQWILLPQSPGNPNEMPDYSNLYINEVDPKNEGQILDEYGEADDWIELFNNNPYAIDIGGLYFSDDPAKLTKSRIPTDEPKLTTLAPYDYFILWADDSTEQGCRHLDFKISKSGEWLVLYNKFALEPNIIDSVTMGDVDVFQSFGRNPDNPEQWKYFLHPTPGKANENEGSGNPDTIILPEITMLDELSFVPNPFNDILYCRFAVSPDNIVCLKLYTAQGTLVKAHKYVVYDSTEIMLNTSDLPPGIYLATLQIGNSLKTFQLIRE